MSFPSMNGVIAQAPGSMVLSTSSRNSVAPAEEFCSSVTSTSAPSGVRMVR